ncbi:MAG: hypothetical protein ACHQRL_03415 [Gemmatimonadales bacterium]|jgi:hypothetical protein
MRICGRDLLLGGAALASLFATPSIRAQGRAAATSATIEKPAAKARTVTAGSCRVLGNGTFMGSWGPTNLPTLSFTIGPHAAMSDEMHANKISFTGPGRYTNVIVAAYLGATALVDSYGGLGTVVFSDDGHSGTFVTNDGKASGRFDCGVAPKKEID